jgi:hypothetical protein
VVGEALEVDDDVSGSSVSVTTVVVVDEGRTGVKVSGGGLEMRRVVRVVGVAAELDTGFSGEVIPEQSSATRLPASACPNTEISDTSALSQADWRFASTLFRPLTHEAEHVLPATKSFIEHPGISAL